MSEGFGHLITKIGTSVDNISKALDSCLKEVVYSELSTEDRVRYDLFLAYAITSLLWMYLRMNGCDPTQTVIKTELGRIKELMSELQRSIDRKTIMPRVDQEAAKRFVKHSLWDPDCPGKSTKHIRFEE